MDPSGARRSDDTAATTSAAATTSTAAADEQRDAASRASGRDERVQRVVGTWYGTSVPARERGYARWTDPSAQRLVRALLSGDSTQSAAFELGAARRTAGFTRAEVTADWIGLQRVLPAGIRRQVDERALHRNLLGGWARPVAATDPSERRFATAEALDERLAEAYRWATVQGTHPGDGFVLLVADVEVDGGDRAAWGSTVHRLACELSERFDRIERVVELAAGRFGVLVRRHPGLAVTVEALELRIAASVELAGTATLWVVPLPREGDAVPGLRARVSDRATPLWALGHLVTGRREVLAGLMEDSRRWLMPVLTLRRSAAQRAGDVWNGGLRLVAAAVGVLVMTAGLVQAVERDGSEGAAPATPGSASSLAQPWGSAAAPGVPVPLEGGGFAGVGGTTPTTAAAPDPPPAPSPEPDTGDAEHGPTEAGEPGGQPSGEATPDRDARPGPSAPPPQPSSGADSTNDGSGDRDGDGNGNGEGDSGFERGAAPEARAAHAGGPPEDRGGSGEDRPERGGGKDRDQGGKDGDKDRGTDRDKDRGRGAGGG